MRFERDSGEVPFNPEEIARREELVADFVSRYTAPIRHDEQKGDIELGGPSLEVATAAASTVLRSARPLFQADKTFFLTSNAFVEIIPSDQLEFSNINPWSDDKLIKTKGLLTIELNYEEATDFPFNPHFAFLPNLSYQVQLLEGDAARVLATNLGLNETKSGTRIIDEEEATALAELLYSTLNTAV